MKRSIFQIVGLLLLLPLFSGCNDSDDVATIFTGKNWKLTYITLKDGNKMVDLWAGDEAKRKASYEKLAGAGNFTISFTVNTNEDDIINGNLNGQVTIGKSMSGSWNANGKKSTFNISNLDAGSDGDVLAKEFITGLQGADSFKGSDERNLYLYYSSGNQTRCLVFAPSKN
jgi:hypothetical protein